MAALVMLSAVLLGLLLPFSMADNNNILYRGDTLNTGESLTEGEFTFIMQSDCNLVLYANDNEMWSTATNNLGFNCVAHFQTNADLVIRGDDGNVVWSSNTSQPEGEFILVLQRDGRVVIYGNPIFNIPNAEPRNRKIRKVAMGTKNYCSAVIAFFASITSANTPSLLVEVDDVANEPSTEELCRCLGLEAATLSPTFLSSPQAELSATRSAQSPPSNPDPLGLQLAPPLLDVHECAEEIVSEPISDGSSTILINNHLSEVSDIRSLTMAALVMLSAVVFLGLLLPSSMADSVLDGGRALYSGQSLTQGDYTFIMQSDCNLVLYDKGRAVWASKTNGRGPNCVLRLRTDGNLVVYDGSNKLVWASNTGGSRGYYILVLQRDRNVVIYGCPRWATGTSTADSEGVVIVKSDRNDNTSFTPQVVVPAADEPTNRKIAMVTNN
ncbi:uncharacterized protein LOC141842827 [Curcuma longa]|uniref:uncharacterized protein LOC141842827 n=1 Tax=Curcuma longa TaxID=136217 RepID=UPI003D9F1BD5